jgi:ribonucleoside-diphosphate reductase alpha chain
LSEKLSISQWAQKLSQIKSKEEKLKEIDLNLSKNALTVLETRYLQKDDQGNYKETPKEAFYRVAHAIAQAEKNYTDSDEVANMVENAFLEILTNLEFLPNSPTFSGAGTKLGQLSACFVLPIEDDMKSIMKTLTDAVMIHKSGGGTGFSFSRLRPDGSRISTTNGSTSGPISFIKMYDGTTEQVKQGGVRRGASMGILRVDHPDILDFIDAKKKEGDINNFNLSVAITDKFMKAVKKDATYKLYDPYTKKHQGELEAKKVFNKMVENAWLNGEPGAFFIDRANRDNPTPNISAIESTNPCGEEPLMPYESCNLGSINLDKFVQETEEGEMKIKWDRLKYVTRLAVRFLDNVIDVNKYPIDEIAQTTRKTRKIGLGIMGYANMLLKLKIRYDSEEALELADEIMSFIKKESQRASQTLAKKRGVFPAWEGSTWEEKGIKIRNAALNTIAPTGTLSFIAQTSPGIEPIFAIAFVRNVLDGQKLIDANPVFEKIAKERGFHSKELMEKIAEGTDLKDLDEVPEDIKNIFITSHDIKPEAHIKTQATFQKHIDAGISKTINFPNSATKKDVEEAYLMADRLGLKGMTIYRDGSREKQVMEKGKKKEEKQKKEGVKPTKAKKEAKPRKRPDSLIGYTYKTQTSYGNLYVTINEDEEGKPFEVFANIGKAGGFYAAKAEAISRLISLALRSRINVKEVIGQLKGIRGPQTTWGEEGKIYSLSDAIAQTLEKYLKSKDKGQQLNLDLSPQKKSTKKEDGNSNTQAVAAKPQSNQSIADVGEAPGCPECGSMLSFSEGCATCPICGYSKCS